MLAHCSPATALSACHAPQTLADASRLRTQPVIYQPSRSWYALPENINIRHACKSMTITNYPFEFLQPSSSCGQLLTNTETHARAPSLVHPLLSLCPPSTCTLTSHRQWSLPLPPLAAEHGRVEGARPSTRPTRTQARVFLTIVDPSARCVRPLFACALAVCMHTRG